MSKKIEVCNGKTVSKKKLKKCFKKIRKDVYKTLTCSGLTKKDIKRLLKDGDAPTPKDEEAYMRAFESVFPEYKLTMM